VVRFVHDHEIGRRRSHRRPAEGSSPKRLYTCHLDRLLGARWSPSQDHAGINADLPELGTCLVDQLAAMGQEQNARTLLDGKSNDLAGDYGLAAAGRRDQ
jgi:hypothetical protein